MSTKEKMFNKAFIEDAVAYHTGKGESVTADDIKVIKVEAITKTSEFIDSRPEDFEVNTSAAVTYTVKGEQKTTTYKYHRLSSKVLLENLTSINLFATEGGIYEYGFNKLRYQDANEALMDLIQPLNNFIMVSRKGIFTEADKFKDHTATLQLHHENAEFVTNNTNNIDIPVKVVPDGWNTIITNEGAGYSKGYGFPKRYLEGERIGGRETREFGQLAVRKIIFNPDYNFDGEAFNDESVEYTTHSSVIAGVTITLEFSGDTIPAKVWPSKSNTGKTVGYQELLLNAPNVTSIAEDAMSGGWMSSVKPSEVLPNIQPKEIKPFLETLRTMVINNPDDFKYIPYPWDKKHTTEIEEYDGRYTSRFNYYTDWDGETDDRAPAVVTKMGGAKFDFSDPNTVHTTMNSATGSSGGEFYWAESKFSTNDELYQDFLKSPLLRAIRVEISREPEKLDSVVKGLQGKDFDMVKIDSGNFDVEMILGDYQPIKIKHLDARGFKIDSINPDSETIKNISVSKYVMVENQEEYQNNWARYPNIFPTATFIDKNGGILRQPKKLEESTESSVPPPATESEITSSTSLNYNGLNP